MLYATICVTAFMTMCIPNRRLVYSKYCSIQDGNPATPASVPAPSPAASSIADESLDEKSRLESPSWSNPNHGQRTPIPPSTSQMHPGGPPAGMMMQAGMLPGIMQPGMMPPTMQPVRKESIVDKLYFLHESLKILELSITL
uniref:Mediator complex subunit 29 n=1 Tax=Heterorhabditis bacteriophora TaxID=37862 RepID=A0A1I7WX47_HETBA